MTNTSKTTESKTFNTTHLSDEQFRALLDGGYTVKDIEQFAAQVEYRRVYNQRPDVKEKRAEYNRKRNLKMKTLRSLLNEQLG